MLDNNWRVTKDLKPGNVLVWEEKLEHQHIGFYLGKDKAISNSSEKRLPIIHDYKYNNKRKIIQILTHKIIE